MIVYLCDASTTISHMTWRAPLDPVVGPDFSDDKTSSRGRVTYDRWGSLARRTETACNWALEKRKDKAA